MVWSLSALLGHRPVTPRPQEIWAPATGPTEVPGPIRVSQDELEPFFKQRPRRIPFFRPGDRIPLPMETNELVYYGRALRGRVVDCWSESHEVDDYLRLTCQYDLDGRAYEFSVWRADDPIHGGTTSQLAARVSRGSTVTLLIPESPTEQPTLFDWLEYTLRIPYATLLARARAARGEARTRLEWLLVDLLCELRLSAPRRVVEAFARTDLRFTGRPQDAYGLVADLYAVRRRGHSVLPYLEGVAPAFARELAEVPASNVDPTLLVEDEGGR